MLKDNQIKLNNLIDKYNLDGDNKIEFLSIIMPIVSHSEFQRRMTNEFLHHSNITLGEHIIEDAIVTYLLCKNTKKNININLAVKIAMFHDLYTIPWQNNKKNTKVKKVSNKHGFRHPIEAVVNAYSWYPDEFNNEKDAEIIIDGIIHHMYPLPVVRVKESNYNSIELRNYEEFKKLPNNIKNLIIKSSNRRKLFKLSFCKSKYNEGRIMSKSDKKVSFHQIKNVSSATALVTGKNKSLKKHK